MSATVASPPRTAGSGSRGASGAAAAAAPLVSLQPQSHPSQSSSSPISAEEEESSTPSPPPGVPDPLYERLRSEALQAAKSEPAISCLLHRTVLDAKVTNFNQAVAAAIAHRLGSLCGTAPDICPEAVRSIINDALDSDERVLGWTMAEAVREDVLACVDRDPACLTILEPLLFFKGFAALVLHRAARRRWGKATGVPGEMSRFVSFWLQSQASAAFGVDIHPAATIGRAIMLDHATGIVIGETAVVGDGCSLLHGVTLGGTGKSKGKDRHPKVGRDVLIGAGTSVLGNISIGDGAKIGAGSVVLQPIPHGATAVGAPAKVVGRAMESKPGTENDTSMRDVVMVHFHPHRNKVRRGRGSRHPLDKRRSRSVGSVDEAGNFDDEKARRTVVMIGAEDAVATEEIKQTRLVEHKSWPGAAAEGLAGEEEVVVEEEERIGGLRLSSSSSSGSSDEEKKDSTPDESSTSASSGKGSCLDAQMCIWRSFGEAEPPEGTLNIYQLRRLLQKEGATEAEIGEVFFSLVDDEPYITEERLREKFPEVAKKYTKIGSSSLDRILGSMCQITSPHLSPKKSISSSGRLRSNSIPEDFPFGSQNALTAAASRLATIDSQVSLVDASEDTKQ